MEHAGRRLRRGVPPRAPRVPRGTRPRGNRRSPHLARRPALHLSLVGVVLLGPKVPASIDLSDQNPVAAMTDPLRWVPGPRHAARRWEGPGARPQKPVAAIIEPLRSVTDMPPSLGSSPLVVWSQ